MDTIPDREARLDAIRDEARARGEVAAEGMAIAGGPLPPDAPVGYYGQPVLKAPVWTWEIPLYFAVGGIAGMAAAIAAVASLTGADPALAGDARLVALGGAIVSPLLLISDLGRPSRFLNMLRVFKSQSPMSVGAWTLVLFSSAAAAAWLLGLPQTPPGWTPLRVVVDVVAAVLGLTLATYTGVLLGVSAVPVWTANARRLPLLFAASSLGAAISAVELFGHFTPAANVIGIAAAAGEVLFSGLAHRDGGLAGVMRDRRTRLLLLAADVVGAAIPLVLRLFAADLVAARTVAAAATIAGTVCLRYGWIAAGGVSTTDPSAALDPAAK
ncbi:MAG: NrfD/PsrC family molybdoenzyme membrane anchor subunit [Vicinamibacterales bacterium]